MEVPMGRRQAGITTISTPTKHIKEAQAEVPPTAR